MEITNAHNGTPAYRVAVERGWRTWEHFNVSLVTPEGHITFFSRLDRQTATHIAGELAFCDTYGEQRAAIQALRARLFPAD